MQINSYQHFNHAHCESGVATNLLRHYNIPISEPLAFGIGSGLFFIHVPFLKVNGIPGTNYRSYPGLIFRNLMKSLNVEYKMQSFGSNKQQAKAKLDELLEQNIPVGMISSVFYLTYLPEVFRFHFNAHSLIAVGKKENDQYLISDPLIENIATIDYVDLEKARFAKGALPPKGKMYNITKVPDKIDFEHAVRKGIKRNLWLYFPPKIVPYVGNQGIHTLANRIEKYPQKLSERQASLYLGNIIRMQEEIGTGGGGFRFIYAAFLQEAAGILGLDVLKEFSERMTNIGDEWRYFAVEASRICKNRGKNEVGYKELANMLHKIGDTERDMFLDLKKVKL